MRHKFLIFLLLMPFSALAQYHITGKIIDIATKKPIADASVFLSNASVGTKTNSDGTFYLTNVRGGQYEMVVSIIGYTIYKQTIMANKDLNLPEIQMSQLAIQLQEVRITGIDKHWAEHYAVFKREFLGTMDNAQKCDILNPHVLSFDRDSGVFMAHADKMLIIENKALGYRINYLLNSFSDDSRTGVIYFEGEAFFENLKGRKGRIAKWTKNRLLTYQGSDMHFLRSIINDRVKEEGFLVQRMVRTPNPNYRGGLRNKYLQTLVTTPLTSNEYAVKTDQKGEYALAFKDGLAVSYQNNPLSGSIIDINAAYAYFDNNGIILNPQNVIMEGSWGESRIAEMLPVDYEPPVK